MYKKVYTRAYFKLLRSNVLQAPHPIIIILFSYILTPTTLPNADNLAKRDFVDID
jgi:hypothetical protein